MSKRIANLVELVARTPGIPTPVAASTPGILSVDGKVTLRDGSRADYPFPNEGYFPTRLDTSNGYKIVNQAVDKGLIVRVSKGRTSVLYLPTDVPPGSTPHVKRKLSYGNPIGPRTGIAYLNS